MTKWVFLFWAFAGFEVHVAAQRPVPGGGVQSTGDTVELSFGWMGGRSGDTNYLYMGPPAETWPASPAYFERYYNKNLRGIYRGDTAAVAGTVIVWFVIDRQGKYVAGHCDTAVCEPELAQEVMRVTNKMNSAYAITPSRIGGKPVVSRVKMRVVYQYSRDGEMPPPPEGPKPDILVVCFPPQR